MKFSPHCSLVAGFLVCVCPLLSAATIVDDSFTDGKWRTGSPTAGARTEPDAAQWYVMRSSAAYSIVTDTGTGGINDGNALRIGGTLANLGAIGVASSTLTLGAAGSSTDKIVLSFDFRMAAYGAASDSGLRLGLFDASPIIAADGGASTTYTNKGYGVDFGLVSWANNASRFAVETGTGSAGTMLAGGDRTTVGSTFTYGLNNTTAHSAVFTLTRTGATSITLSLMVDNVLISSATDASASVFSYRHIAFFMPSANSQLVLDNVTLASLSSIPEPSTWALLMGAGAFLMVGIRRIRRHRDN